MPVIPASRYLASVLLPCFNAAGTLVEALDSLQKQTFSDFEIIAVDDGSTDASKAILQEWERGEPRLKVCTQEHGGIISALNTGLGLCQSELIVRMDCDDWSHPERIEQQVAYLAEHPQAALVGCLVEGFPEGEVRQGFRIYMDWQNSLISDAEIRREIFVESPFAHPSVAIRRSWIDRVGGYQEQGWAEDYDLWLRLYQAGAQFAKLPRVLIKWREHPERLTRTDSRYSLENFLRAKAHYLVLGPLAERDSVLIWGAGMVGRRLAKHLLREGAPLSAFVDIDPRKIGRTRRGLPVLASQALPEWWKRHRRPAVLAAVGARGARQLIRKQLDAMGFVEGRDWWGVA